MTIWSIIKDVLIAVPHGTFDDDVETLLLGVGNRLFHPAAGIWPGVKRRDFVVLAHKPTIFGMINSQIVADDLHGAAALRQVVSSKVQCGAFAAAWLPAKNNRDRPRR